ncbi:MAG: M1 family metallopeptidase [Christensenellaceae bacterium]|nr:M1 family metallopeptidase [Christensenellaceae bacterium]
MSRKLSREENRRAWLWASVIVALMMTACAAVILILRVEWPQPIHLPDERPETLAASEGLDEIVIDAVFDPEARLLTATQVMTLRNRTGQDQSAVVLRSWSGAYLLEETSPAASDELYAFCYEDGFNAGGLRLSGAEVNGSSAAYRWLDGARTMLSIPADWGDGEIIRLALTYRVDIPECSSRFGYADGTFALGNVFPTAAVWMDGEWRLDKYTAVGDPFFSECANWTVRLTLPEGYTVAATGAGETAVSGGMQVCTLSAKTARDFCLVISDHWAVRQRMEGDVLLTACASTASSADAMLNTAARALRCYEERYGSYGYPTLTLAEVDFPFGGMEYPRLVMIGADVIASGGDGLAYIVAHEVAHQWWAVQVGSDGWYQPWQDESLCEYALLDYIEAAQGQSMRASAAYDRIETSLRITVPGGITPGSPLDYFANMNEYSLVVYSRGAALWLALENYLGKDGLDALLRDYQHEYLFRIATREDLTELISRHAGVDMAPLMLDYLDTQIAN